MERMIITFYLLGTRGPARQPSTQGPAAAKPVLRYYPHGLGWLLGPSSALLPILASPEFPAVATVL